MKSKVLQLQVPPEMSVRRAMTVLQRVSEEIVLVVDKQRRLIGTVTDGDIRRGLLRGLTLQAPVRAVMHRRFIAAGLGTGRQTLINLMLRREIKQVPLLDAAGRVRELALLADLVRQEKRGNRVVLMAGGAGRRLRPLTNTVPKPLVKVGGKPILETIIEQLALQGFRDITLAVHHRARQIIDYFGDGTRWGVTITYLREKKKLGTVGALALLADDDQPLLVVNCDLLNNIDFRKLVAFHTRHRFALTVCVRRQEYRIPYGVVRLRGRRVLALEEKPVHDYHINAGVYMVSPAARRLVPHGRRCDATQLINACLRRGLRVGAFPHADYWLDIGQLAEYEQAVRDFDRVVR